MGRMNIFTKQSKRQTKAGVAAHICNLTTQEGEIGFPGVQGQPELQRQTNMGENNKPCQNQKSEETGTQVKMKYYLKCN